MKSDPGYFGPNSIMWKVNKEITVLFGGARALLMHAASVVQQGQGRLFLPERSVEEVNPNTIITKFSDVWN